MDILFDMKIGLPKALLYYKYGRLWRQFFCELGQDVVESPDTNRTLMQDGINSSVDECCLPAKIYMGHVRWLTDKCDAVLVPRIDSFGKKESVCVKFNALYDIVRNTLCGRLLCYDVDEQRGQSEYQGFVSMGRELGFSRRKSAEAYRNARMAQNEYDEKRRQDEERALENGSENSGHDLESGSKSSRLKILFVGHAYNCYDKMIGYPITQYLKKLGCEVLYADRLSGPACTREAAALSPTLYWTFNKELAGAAALYGGRADGIIFITAFPCGPDSLVTELLIRKLKAVPVCNIVVDELQSEAGLQTRIESFVDILSQRKASAGRSANCIGE